MTRRESRLLRLPHPIRLGVCGALCCSMALTGSATGQQTPDPLVTSGVESWLARVQPAGITAPAVPPPIAITETGFDSRHPDMQGGWVTQRRYGPSPDPADTAAVSEYVNGIAHGTAVASIIGAPRNGVGMEGLLPGATVWVYGSSGYCSDVAAAVRQAVRDGARVINMSLGFSTEGACVRLRDAVAFAYGVGTLVVASAGNYRPDQQWIQPGNDWHVLTVGAVNAFDMTTSFSQQNNALDLTAPGEGILVAIPPELDTMDGAADGYATGDGTSFSAPMVSAAAAWVMAARPGLSAGQVADVLRYSARDLGRRGWDRAYGWGVPDIAAALTEAEPLADPTEPNEDIKWVSGRAGFKPDPPLLGRKRNDSLRASLDITEDPYDVYRVSIPIGRAVRIRAVSTEIRLDLSVYQPTARFADQRGQLVARSAKPGTNTQEVTVVNNGARTPGYIDIRFRKGRSLGGRYTLTLQVR